MSEANSRAGDYDNAAVEIWLVNWQDVTQRLLLRRAISARSPTASVGFTAEVRGLAHLLNQPKGRCFNIGCDADAGRCALRVDLDSAAFRGDGSVVAVEDNRRLQRSGLDGFAEGWFARGRLTWTSGANAGRSIEVNSHRIAPASSNSGGGELCGRAGRRLHHPRRLRQAIRDLPGEISTTGRNFRGFPHMPGNDSPCSYPRPGEGNSGGALGLMAPHSDPTRAAVVAETLSWLGTPYRHQASLKGIGYDCLGLVRGGLARSSSAKSPERLPAYTPDWAEAGGIEGPGSGPGRRHLGRDRARRSRPQATCCCFAGGRQFAG